MLKYDSLTSVNRKILILVVDREYAQSGDSRRTYFWCATKLQALVLTNIC